MRTTIFLLFTCVFISVAETGYTQNAKVTLNKNSVDLKEVLNEIENQTDYLFIYNNKVNTNKTVSVKTKNGTVKTVLAHVLKDSDIDFSMEGNHIILSYIEKQLNEKNEAKTETVQQQGRTITGTIVDAQGEPIIGANIIEKGTSNGTITDYDGNFSLNVANNAVLTISYIGYKTQSINTSGKSVINTILLEDSEMLDEVVAIGYGTQQRSLVTSAISKLTIDESTNRQVQSASQLLDGRIAGVSTTTGSGNLGSGERMSIRGTASISAGNEPLYVIDGVPITNDNANLFNFGESMSSLATLNTSDIESIVVLKDAASAAIYGSRATNGVIVITTKSGKEGRSDIQLNVSTGISKFPNIGKVKLADSKLYIKDYNSGVNNYNKQYDLSIGDSGYKIPISNPFGNLPDTDWMDLITQTGTMINIDGSFSGGTKKTKYYMGANYNTTEGIIITNKLDKVNLNAKISHEFAPWIEVGVNNLANYTKNYQVPGAELGSTVIGRAIEHRPFDRPYKPNGEYYIGGTDELTRHNIVQILNEQEAYLENFRFLGNYYTTLKYKDKVSWKYSFMADVNSTYDYTYYNENHPYGMGQGRLIDQNRLIKNFVSENVVNYNDKFKDISLNATLGHSFQKVTNRNSTVDGRGFPSPSFSVASVASEILGSTSKGVYAMESYFGRAILSYQDRYILAGTYRTDGSSKFAKDKRWGGFPSISAGWNISNEKFMEDSNTELKFRLSYGKTGNQVGIGRYDYQALMSGGYNYRGLSGIAVSSFGNQDLTWETANQYDVGLDITLFRGKVNMMIDAYQKNTKDLLYGMPIHATSGVTSIMSNIGTMRNRGLEFTLNTHLTFNNVEWLTQFNIATNNNKITSLIDETTPFSIGGNRALKVGEEMGAFYIFEMEGIYQYDGEVSKEQYEMGIRAGDVKWRDVDGNGIINDNDRVMKGSSNPDFYGGLNNTLRYKGFQLDAFLTYMYGNDVYAQWMTTVARAGYRMATIKEYAENAWSGPGSTNKYARSLEGDVSNNRNSDRWLQDGSFIRLRSITLGYNIPKTLLKTINIQNMRLYCQIDNPFILTKYKGWDPEISNNLDPRFIGVDNWNVPQPRMFVLGTSINF